MCSMAKCSDGDRINGVCVGRKLVILANGKRHPREMGGGEVEAFLTRLATHGEVAAGTQNQALAALLFLYREVLGQELPWMDNVVRAKRRAGCRWC